MKLWPFTRKGYRSLSTELAYHKHRRRGTECEICNYDADSSDAVEAQPDWLVIKNKFPYKQWDWRPVSDHLMIIPTRHITRLDELTADEWRQFGDIAARYDADGYSTYMRSPLNQLKTVAHLHWHLIQAG